MKRTLLGIVALGLVLTPLFAQRAIHRITYPRLPSREALDRLSLTLAWATKLRVAGERDGLFSVQVLPGKDGTQLLVQTRAGVVSLLDGETGDVLWSTPVGPPYWEGQAGGYNGNSIFITRRDMLYVLNRATGRQRVYTINEATRQKDFGIRLQSVPGSPITADDVSMFVGMAGGRLSGYVLPVYEAPPPPAPKPPPAEAAPKADEPPAEEKEEKVEKAPPPPPVVPMAAGAPKESAEGLPPVQVWSDVHVGVFVNAPPLIAGPQVSFVTTGGTIYSYEKLERVVRGDFALGATVAGGMGQYGMTAYVATEDGGVYAVDMDKLRLIWRFLAGGLVKRTPAVTDADVFVTAVRIGLFRLQRANGRGAWDRPNRDVNRFLAVNDRFVYGLDPTGLFCVLDGLRGGTLATYDLRDWRIPVANEFTDRVYLANHDGQILCLRHRDLAAPLRNKAFEVRVEVAPKKGVFNEPAVKKEPPPPEEKVEPKKKEPKKVEDKEDKKADDKKAIKDKDEKKDDADLQTYARPADAPRRAWVRAAAPVGHEPVPAARLDDRRPGVRA
jgi:outer membrane protein assembly factor BamB